MRRLAVFALLLVGCPDPSGGPLTLLSVSPDNALEGSAIEIIITGDKLVPRAFTDFNDRTESRIEAVYAAQLGTTSLRNVRLDAQGRLHALVPEGIPTGVYDLKVTDPYRREGVLAGAFKIVPFQETDSLIAGYRIEKVEPQHVFSPFTLKVTAIDAQGADVKQFNGSVSLEDLTGSLVPKAAGAFAFGRWAGKVEVRSPHEADVITVRDAQGRTGVSNPFAVGTSSPAALRFSTPPRTAVADACSDRLTVDLRDGIGVVSAAERDVELTLTPTPAAGFALFADDSCTTPLVGPRIARGASRLSFRFKGTQVGSISLEAAAAGLISDTQVQQVVPSASAKLAFVSAPQTVVAGTCSAAVTIQAQDAFNNPAVLAVQVPVALVSTLSIFSDPACTAQVTTVELPAGAGTKGFYVKSNVAKVHAIVISSSGLVSSAQDETVIAAPPAQLVFTTPPQTQFVGACSSLAGLQTRDVFDNAAPVAAPLTVSLGVVPAGLALFSDPACAQPATAATIGSLATSGGFYFKGSAVGSHTVTASSGTLTPASQLETIALAPADRLVFLTPPQTLIAGSCSAQARVQAQDMNGTAVTAVAPVSIGLTGFSFYSDASCATAATTVSIAAGTDTAAFFFRSTVAGVQTATAAVSGWMPAAQNETILAGPRDRLSFVTPSRTVAPNVCSPAVSLGLVDVFGNATTSLTPLVVNVSAAPSTGFNFHSDPACTAVVSASTLAAGGASTTLYFRGSQAAQITLSASATGVGGTTQSALVNPGGPTSLVFVTPSRTISAGGCSGVLTVQTRDAFGNPSVVPASAPLTLTASPATGFSFYSDGSCTLLVSGLTFAAGVDAVSFYFRGTAAGPVQLTAATNALTANQSATVLPGATSQLVFDSIGAQFQYVPFAVTIRARDAFGNLTPSFTGSAALLSFPAGQVTPSGSGTFTAGVWSGAISLDTPGLARRVDAAAGAIAGISNAFDVASAPVQSPPSARLAAITPAAAVVGQPISLSAAGSIDYATSAALLQNSFDFTGVAAGNPPWSAFSTVKNADATFATPGLYEVRLAVRDGDSEVGYASAVVKAVASAAELCTVTTASVDDDGAASCAGPFGTDGALSIAEAVRLANAGSNLTIVFAGPLAISGAGRLALSVPMTVLGSAGVSLAVPIDVGAVVMIAGLDLSGAPSASTVSSTGVLTLKHVVQRGGAGWINRGDATFSYVELSGCVGDCLTDDGGSALSVEHSVFAQSASSSGILVSTCAVGASALDVSSTKFVGLGSGVRALCNRPMTIVHSTFDQNGRAVAYSGGTGHILRNSLFTRQSIEAVACGTATFTARDFALLFQNAADGCIGGDPNGLTIDPLFLYLPARDYRLKMASPAADSAATLGRDLNGPGPGDYFGAGPDRGAGESD